MIVVDRKKHLTPNTRVSAVGDSGVIGDIITRLPENVFNQDGNHTLQLS